MCIRDRCRPELRTPRPPTNHSPSIGVYHTHRPIPAPQYGYTASVSQSQSLNRNMCRAAPFPRRPSRRSRLAECACCWLAGGDTFGTTRKSCTGSPGCSPGTHANPLQTSDQSNHVLDRRVAYLAPTPPPFRRQSNRPVTWIRRHSVAWYRRINIQTLGIVGSTFGSSVSSLGVGVACRESPPLTSALRGSNILYS
eukprot:9012318-Pyramimonas_sp.AAC.1